MKTLAERIILAREHKGLKQNQLAALIPIKQQSLSTIEQGKTRTKKTKRIAEILGVAPEWLDYGSNPPQWVIDLENSQSHSLSFEHNNYGTPINCYFKKNAIIETIKDYAMVLHTRPEKSMHPGESIIIEPDIKPDNHDVVYVRIKGIAEPVFREYFVEGENIYFQSLNNDKVRYPDYRFNDIEEIVGVVTFHGSFRKKLALEK
jgi:transcriptional regulator with XRE-family HTH domain